MNKTYFFLITFLFSFLSARSQSGFTLEMTMDIAANSYGNMHPRVAPDGDGNPMVIWGRMSDESVFFSKWNGSAFTTPVKLNPPGMTVATASWMGPDIASKGDTVYVVMKRTPESSDTNHIYIISSFDGGDSFSSLFRVDFIADSMSRFPTVTVDETGNPVVAFMKFNSNFLDSRWVVTRSSDFGNTFSADVKASGFSGMNSEVCDCCPGAIVTSGNTSAMLYRDNLSNIRDVWTGISNDNNASFTQGFNVDENAWMVMACPSSGPDGIIYGDTLYSVFMNAANGNPRSYLSKSSLSNVSLDSVRVLGEDFPGLSQQNYPRIANDGNKAIIVWKQIVSGSAVLPVIFTDDLTMGFPSLYSIVDQEDVTNVDVMLNQGNVVIVWQDDNSGTIKYRKGNYAPVITSLKRNDTDGISVFPNPVNDILKINTSDKMMFSVRISNLTGQEIYLGICAYSGGVDVSDLAPGIYFAQINSSGKTVTRKFIKQ